MSRSARAALLLALAVLAGCKTGLFGRQYEYEEDLTIGLDGSATLVVNASLPALAALRGIDLDLKPSARVDRDRIRAAYESPVTAVQRISSPWFRDGRQFVQIRLRVSDIRKLSEAAPFSWSRYRLDPEDGHYVYRQTVGASALRPGTLKNYGWNGTEVVAFRLHLPSKILWHNTRDLDTNEPKDPARGNILAWEQHLADRLDGTPLEFKVVMDSQSILYRTLWLFAAAFLSAVAVLAGLIWWTMRKGAHEAATTTAP
jgi:hypothetical protein